MKSEQYDTRLINSGPYDRMRWQQQTCNKDIIGYAVGLASERTERAAYMSGIGTEITNREEDAVVLPKPEAAALMTQLYTSDDFLAPEQYKIAFLVPVSADFPLSLCTFSGY